MELVVFIIVVALFVVGFFVVRNNKRKKDEEICVMNARIDNARQHVDRECQSIKDWIDSVLAPEHYFTFSEKDAIEKKTKEFLSDLSLLMKYDDNLKKDINLVDLFEILSHIETMRASHNQLFVKSEINNRKEFFDSALDYPLDMQQREAIVKAEDNCLVVSSAGSGKTSTMVGKLLYLTCERKMQPSRILTITYTHKAADELSQRLVGTGLSCMTFHKLAMTVVSSVEGKMPSISDNSLFMNVFYEQMKDSQYQRSILNFLTDHKSLVLDEHDYSNSIEYYKDRLKYGVIALYPDMDDRMISTKSEEEKKICSYLTELGVSFRYEEPYEFQTMTEDYRQYRPDFSIYYKDSKGNENRIYLEHFAINAQGNVPKWFGAGVPDGWNVANQRYSEGIQWKKELHRFHGTTLLYTTSADFHNHSIKEKLRTLLLKVGVPIEERSPASLMDKIITRNKSAENALLQMIQGFVNLAKANGKSIDDIRAKANARDGFVIDRLVRPVWNKYQSALDARGEMDFTDVILKATQYCREGKWNQKYEYILIDEFQDISMDRYNLLLALRSDIPKTKLFCVGDDWQSIYRFSGSDLSLFSSFSKFFGYTEECKIETTYRFGNPLIKRSSKFILTNPLQKVKHVNPRKVNPPETKLSFMAYENNEGLQNVLRRMIERVPLDKSVYIISRYSYDIKVLASPFINMTYDANCDSVSVEIAGRKVKFLTIHASKGLEADYVFMLNCNSGLYGFPSLISDDPILDYVLSSPDHYEYAEERRVFYVGITRAKVHTVVLYNKNTPSPFVTEMDGSVVVDAKQCPLCGVGHQILKYEGWTKQKTPYRVWGCDNKAANCQYFEREFFKGKRMDLQGKKFSEN